MATPALIPAIPSLLLEFASACCDSETSSPSSSSSSPYAANLPTEFPYGALPSPLPKNADPPACPLDIFRVLIATQVVAITGSDNLDLVYDAIELLRDTSIADFCIPTPRLRIKGSPAEITAEIASKFVPNSYILRAFATGNFVNFDINHGLLRAIVLPAIICKAESYGYNSSGAGKVAALDMSSPNIAKPFHAGHLRSTIIGNFIRNILNANGWKTVAINYLGDWGKQYGLLAVGFAKFGDEAELMKDPIQHLYSVYVKINAFAEETPSVHDDARDYFKRMEDGDQEALSLWQKFRDLSISCLELTYKRLGVSFDSYSGESQVKNTDEMMELLRKSNLLVDSEGAKIVDLSKSRGQLGKVVVEKSNGTKLYFTRDIGAAYKRHAEYAFDEMFYVVASQQDLHFRQLFEVLKMLDATFADKLTHVSFGLVNGMSTRKGNVVFLEDILNQARDQMLEVMQRNPAKMELIDDPLAVADAVGISAVIVQDLSARRIRDYKFDWSRMLSFEGDTGPYLQYAHARLCSIERAPQAAELVADPRALLAASDYVGVFNRYADESARPIINRLVFMIAKYPDLIRTVLANRQFEPCNLVTYLFQLCHCVSTTYEKVRALDPDENVRRACVLLYFCTRMTLANGLKLIGLRPVNKM